MRKLLALLLSVLLTACGGGSGGGGTSGGGSTPPTVPVGAVTGSTFDGLIIGGNVKVYDFTSGSKGAVLAQGTSDSTGRYNLSLQIESKPLLVEVTGGYYFEEAGTGLQIRPGSGHALTAVVNYTTGTTLAVSATTFTHIAAGLAAFEIGGGTAVTTAINDANGRVSGWAGFDILTTAPKAINDAANASNALTPELRYGFTSGAISQWTYDHAPAGTTPHVAPYTSIDFAQLLYKDISADGLLDGQGYNSIGILSQLSFGTTPLSVDVYRHQLGVSMLRVANTTNNKTGLIGSSVLGYVQAYIASTDAMFNSVLPVTISAPLVAVNSPAINGVLMRTTTVSATATTNGEIAKAELLVDNAVVSTLTSSTPSFSLDTTMYSDGAHTLKVRFTDTGGLSTTSTAVPVLIVNTVPAVTVVSPVANAVIGGAAVTITATTQSTVGLAAVELLVDGVPVATATNLAAPTFSLDTRTYTDGAHTLKVRATDAGGQVAVSTVPVVVANIAPNVTVSAPAANALVRGSITVTAAASSGSGIAAVELLVDNTVAATAANPAAPSFTLDTTPYADGMHAIKVRATDVGGLSTTATVAGVIFDNVAPAVAVSAPFANEIVRGTITVSGTATSAAGIASVALLVDNSVVATNPASASFTLNTALYLDGAHTVAIRATDIGGLTTTTSVPVVIDNVAPALTITAPAANAILQTTVSVTASASSGAGLKTVELLVDGFLTTTATNLTSPTFSLQTTGYADGAHTIAVRATDVGGLVTTKSVPVTIANVPPLLSITAPAATSVLVGTATITGSAQTGSGISKVGLYVDGTFVAWTTTPAAPSFSLNTAAFADGGHVIQLTATDVGGNTTSSSVPVVFDNIAPAVTISAPGNGSWARSAITVSGSVSDAAGLVSTVLLIDGTQVATAINAASPTFTVDTTTLTEASHTVALRSTDVGGHVTTTTYTIKVDNTAPTANLSAGVYSGTCGSVVAGVLCTPSTNGTYPGTIADNYSGAALVRSLDNLTTAAPGVGGAWTLTVSIPLGFSTATFEVKDAAGNCSTYNIAAFSYRAATGELYYSVAAPGGLVLVRTGYTC